MNDLLQHCEHRPWPLPRGPWIGTQVWERLLFAHWPLPPDALRPHIPPGLELDCYDGQAWLGIVPFNIPVNRVRGLPPIPAAAAFPELNVRTYVTHQGQKPGVLFFSLDAASLLAVLGARMAYHLPYHYAQMAITGDGATGDIHYRSRRRGVEPPVAFEGRYAPTGPVALAAPGTLDHWLTERYCLYTANLRGRLYRCEIHHPQWPLQPARLELKQNTLTQPLGIVLPDTPPLLHYAHRIEVLIWPLRAVEARP